MLSIYNSTSEDVASLLQKGKDNMFYSEIVNTKQNIEHMLCVLRQA